MTPQKIVRKVKNKESNSIEASLKKMIIIIPVFNEGSNIQILLGTLSKKVPHANLLFVDDNSKDDTVKQIKTYSKKMKGKVNILKRSKKLGLGSAYVSAFKASLKKNYDFFLQMDADLSHNPMYIPEMLQMLTQYDFVIGSRYIKGGGVFGWSWIRKFISFGGNLYARAILMSKIKDLTGGFNLWTRKVLESIDLERKFADGYAFQIELKIRAFKAGFKFYEHPILFLDRVRGISKMDKKIVWEALKKVWTIR